jgi:hypothetical protein
MADTQYLKKVVEPHIVSWVSQHIGILLQKRRVPVGTRMDGSPAHFEFDGVSLDGNVGLLVSASYTIKPGGTRKLHVDASILLQTPFHRRIMAFVNDSVRTNFINKCDGLLPLGAIELMLCDCYAAGNVITDCKNPGRG